MKAKSEKFERLKDFLSRLPSDFCIVYRRKVTVNSVRLKWCKAASREKMTREEYDHLASKYAEIALNSFRHRRNFVIKEALPRRNARGQRWCGFFVHAEPSDDVPPANSLGQRWWQLVVGAGATHQAGYVIVARVAAKEAKEVREYIARIQQIMRDEN